MLKNVVNYGFMDGQNRRPPTELVASMMVEEKPLCSSVCAETKPEKPAPMMCIL